ncbi:hypothetical protein [Nocardia sp. NPDC052112]|uniref:hypothetical protein n=1 Tax=Nocardia sp. NPDC052112 TaxID=3155646 RepID=UPI00341E58E4
MSRLDFLYCGIGGHVEDREQDHPAHRRARQVSVQRQHRVCFGSTAFLDKVYKRRGRCPSIPDPDLR